MTQQEVAAAADLSQETVRRMERADKKVEMANRAAIAEAVGASFDWKSQTVVPPPDIPEARIEWAEHALLARLAMHDVVSGTELAESPKAAASSSEAAKRADARKKKAKE